MPIEQKEATISYLKKLLEAAKAGIGGPAKKEVLQRIPLRVGNIPDFLRNPDENWKNLALVIGDMEYFVERDLGQDLPKRPVELKRFRFNLVEQPGTICF